MAPALTRPLAIPCAGATLAATLHPADGATGVLIVTGGVQTRWGAHRGLLDLAAGLAEAGHPVLRFDRRGVGDSSGDDPGYRDSLPDMLAARDALRAAGAARIVGWGLCDGAAALAIHSADLALDGLILANPWTRDADTAADLPPPAAIAARYRNRMRDPAAWRRLLSGGVNLRKLAGGLVRLAAAEPPSATAAQIAAGLAAAEAPVLVLLSAQDATALAWRALADTGAFGSPPPVAVIEGAGHTFARREDHAAMLAACRDFLARL
ncbi:MAG: hydrolase 1, exosortase A system-associated [Alphaproteobacteria bacterium]|nr:hydrolase 1, exosortase A system-associated [Alphaproteobacteria bacterium]